MNPYRVDVWAAGTRVGARRARAALEGVLELDLMVKGAADAFRTDSSGGRLRAVVDERSVTDGDAAGTHRMGHGPRRWDPAPGPAARRD